MTEQRPDEREHVKWLIGLLRIDLGPKRADDERYKGVRVPDLHSIMDAYDAALARAERAEAVAESAWKFIVVDGDPQADGGEYWDAYNALWNALVEYRHGHRRKNALTAPGHDEEGMSDEAS